MRRLLFVLPLCLFFAPGRPADSAASRVPVPEADINPDDVLPTAEQYEELARTDPIAFLKAGILRYHREVRGYQAVLVKQDAHRRQAAPGGNSQRLVSRRPVQRADALDRRSDRPRRPGPVRQGRERGQDAGSSQKPRRPNARRRRRGSRHRRGRATRGRALQLREFGLKKGSERTLAAWEAALKRGNLKVEYLGVQRRSKNAMAASATC